MTIGERIKKVRERRGMTQEELALACGYKSRSTINKFEKNICEIKCFLSFSHYFYNLTRRLRCAVAILLQIKKGWWSGYR